MKSRIYILSAMFVLSMLFTSRVRADDHNNNCNDHNNNNNNNNSKNCGNDTNLPIDSGITFLAIAGTAIGIFAVKKSRSTVKMASIKS